MTKELPFIVESSAKNFTDKIAYYYNDQQCTFVQFYELVLKTADYLNSINIKTGDTVAVIANNSFEAVVLNFTLNYLGAQVLPINLLQKRDDWLSDIRSADCKLIVADDNYFEETETLGLQTLKLSELLTASRNRKFTVIKSRPTIPEDVITTIIFTSGSGGTRKGVKLSYGNHYYSMLGSNQNTTLESNSCWLLSLPLYHIGGLAICYRAIHAGIAVRIINKFDVKKINQLINQGLVSHLSLVPTMLSSLLLERGLRPFPGTLKAIILGGAGVDQRLLKLIKKLSLPVSTTYGMTETSSQITTMNPTDDKDKLSTSGHILNFRKLRIVNQDGVEVKTGEKGEMEVSGEVLFKGYLGIDNKKTFTSDGWFKSRDFGKLDKDGNLTVLGRSDNMIISGGENIYPEEITNVALEFSEVSDAVVIGVDHPKWGSRPILFVTDKSLEDNIAELKKHLADKLAKIKIPDEIIILAELPRTTIGKIDYQKLREIYTDNKK